MHINVIYKLLTLLIMLCLSACNAENIIPAQEPTLVDITETERNANQAYQEEDWATAEREYAKLTGMAPTNSEPWFRLGNVFVRLNRPNDALQAYREALIRDSKNAKTWHNLGIVQLKQATNTFLEMQNHLLPEDPLYKRAEQVVNSITKLLGQDFVKTQ